MKLLLDTHILLWWLVNDRQLNKKTRELIASSDAPLVSSVTIWEIVVKNALGKLRIDLSSLQADILDEGFEFLPMTPEHALEVARLPLLHRDPFDRMLIAQSTAVSARLLTHDTNLIPYGKTVLVV